MWNHLVDTLIYCVSEILVRLYYVNTSLLPIKNTHNADYSTTCTCMNILKVVKSIGRFVRRYVDSHHNILHGKSPMADRYNPHWHLTMLKFGYILNAFLRELLVCTQQFCDFVVFGMAAPFNKNNQLFDN